MEKYTINLADLSLDDINTVGGKNASLGEMINKLGNIGIKVPAGFALKTNAFARYLEYNQLTDLIQTTLSDLDTTNISELRRVGALIRTQVHQGKIPLDVANKGAKNFCFFIG